MLRDETTTEAFSVFVEEHEVPLRQALTARVMPLHHGRTYGSGRCLATDVGVVLDGSGSDREHRVAG